MVAAGNACTRGESSDLQRCPERTAGEHTEGLPHTLPEPASISVMTAGIEQRGQQGEYRLPCARCQFREGKSAEVALVFACEGFDGRCGGSVHRERAFVRMWPGRQQFVGLEEGPVRGVNLLLCLALDAWRPDGETKKSSLLW